VKGCYRQEWETALGDFCTRFSSDFGLGPLGYEGKFKRDRKQLQPRAARIKVISSSHKLASFSNGNEVSSLLSRAENCISVSCF
jgi:hypothetical protein